ncbi:MAG: 6-carboxytetrahydropterin synthase QueD [Planctomycetota bacterium]|jgi:6-pyruvoyltetrahydropterin/6-carboxytetrahydropterin synthase|nr:6-carboxytetrahydropterin synthase QueD [Planctomycetota bacterium]
MYHLQVEEFFAAAHQLRGYRGKCENLHGHNWRVKAEVYGEKLDQLGMLADFGVVKDILRQTLERLDHRLLNETPPFDQINPTSENLARSLFEALGAKLPENVGIARVTVWESDKCAASYSAGRPGGPIG